MIPRAAALVGLALAAAPALAGGSQRYHPPRDGSKGERCLAEASMYYVPNEGTPAVDWAHDRALADCLARPEPTVVNRTAPSVGR